MVALQIASTLRFQFENLGKNLIEQPTPVTGPAEDPHFQDSFSRNEPNSCILADGREERSIRKSGRIWTISYDRKQSRNLNRERKNKTYIMSKSEFKNMNRKQKL